MNPRIAKLPKWVQEEITHRDNTINELLREKQLYKDDLARIELLVTRWSQLEKQGQAPTHALFQLQSALEARHDA